MNFVSVRDLRSRPRQVWSTLSAEREVVLTSNGRPVAILSAVEPAALETTLAALRRARAQAALADLQQAAVGRFPGGLSAKVVDAEIAAVRRARRR